jgi:phosphatidylserine/phosphatidylglycerophosphate/cardiolipin synthase-like enzyme
MTVRSRCRSAGQGNKRKSAQAAGAAMGDKLIEQAPRNDRQLFAEWHTIEMQLASGYALEKQHVIAALRSATPDVDHLLQLMHTPQVMAFLQVRLELKEKVSPPVDQFLNALEDMLFKSLPIIPASVQRHIANLIEGKMGQVGRPKLHPIRAQSADWHEQPFEPAPGSNLIWCPNNGRRRIADFIDSARETLWIQNERHQGMVIIERLVRAANRGVRVRIMSRALHKLKKKMFEGVSGLRIVHDVGAKVRALKKLKLHGKIMIAETSAPLSDRSISVRGVSTTAASLPLKRRQTTS